MINLGSTTATPLLTARWRTRQRITTWPTNDLTSAKKISRRYPRTTKRLSITRPAVDLKTTLNPFRGRKNSRSPRRKSRKLPQLSFWSRPSATGTWQELMAEWLKARSADQELNTTKTVLRIARNSEWRQLTSRGFVLNWRSLRTLSVALIRKLLLGYKIETASPDQNCKDSWATVLSTKTRIHRSQSQCKQSSWARIEAKSRVRSSRTARVSTTVTSSRCLEKTLTNS